MKADHLTEYEGREPVDCQRDWWSVASESPLMRLGIKSPICVPHSRGDLFALIK